MNERIKKLATQAANYANTYDDAGADIWFEMYNEKFAELIVEATLDQVKERAYYTGDRDWSDAVDRPWIQLEFGYGPLHDAKGVEK